MIDKILSTPENEFLEISGTIFTIRDQSCKFLAEYIKKKKNPFKDENLIFFFAGPTPGFENGNGSIGPTTSSRMVPFFEMLISLGAKALIGKGDVGIKGKDILEKSNVSYLSAFGGAGAYYGKTVEKMETFLFPELGPEAIYKIEVSGFPAIKIY